MTSLLHLYTQFLNWLCLLFGIRTRKPDTIGSGETIVIVGAGFSGLTLTHYLLTSTQYRVVLYDRKSYFEYTPAWLRVMVEPEHMSVSHLQYSDVALLHSSRVTFIQDEIDAITDKAVHAKNSGAWTKYDKLVLAMGSDYPDHIKPDSASLTLADRTTQACDTFSSIAAASSIQVFGGGLVGVELAAEIAERFPSKPLTLRNREPYLLPGFTPVAQKYALEWFRRQPQTEIVLENTIPPFKYVAKENELVFNCTGLTPVKLEGLFEKDEASKNSDNNKSKSNSNSSNNKSNNLKVPSGHGQLLSWNTYVDERSKLLRVTPEFHLIGQEHIFALGDVMIEQEFLNDSSKAYHAPKVAYQSELQAWFVCENLLRQVESRREWRFPQDLATMNECPTLVACSLGKKDGILIFDESVLMTGRLAAINKDILEHTKMMFLRGNIIGGFVWSIADPATLYLHRLYRAFWSKPQQNQA